MKSIIKWIAIVIVLFIALRLLFTGVKWLIQLMITFVSIILDFLANIHIGTIILVLVIASFLAIIYFVKSANKSYDNTMNERRNKSKGKNRKLLNKAIQTTEKVVQIEQLKALSFNEKETTNEYTQAPTSYSKEKPLKMDFFTFVQTLTETQLKEKVDDYYAYLSEYHGEQVGFGEIGAREFVGSILVAEYFPQFAEQITQGHEKVFKKQWGPLQFSEHMDEIIYATPIPYEKWVAVCRELQANHLWITHHICAIASSTFSPLRIKVRK